MGKKKYRLLETQQIIPNNAGWQSGTVSVYRIKALRNIPERGVKKGDLGGYVSSADTLSHEGTCWIGPQARALGKVRVRDDAYLGGTAEALCDFANSMILIQDSVKITDSASVCISRDKNSTDEPKIISRISGNVEIGDRAQIYNAKEIFGEVSIFDDATILGASKIGGTSEISDRAVVNKGCFVIGNSRIFDDAVILSGAKVINSTVRGKAQIGKEEKVLDGDFSKEGIFISPKTDIPKIFIGGSGSSVSEKTDEKGNPQLKSKQEKLLALYAGIKADIASYETDIVKIIKYPVMTDRTDILTLKMTKLLKKAELLAVTPSDPEFEETVSELEDAFLAAESNALKLASTLLSEAEKKKTETAKSLLAIAADEGSSENEKRVSFKQAFKQLEGVLVVPEVAIDAFRVKVGLQELEM